MKVLHADEGEGLDTRDPCLGVNLTNVDDVPDSQAAYLREIRD